MKCCGLVVGVDYFVVQHLDMSRCCGLLANLADLLHSFRLVVDMLGILLYLYSLLYNKSATNRSKIL